MAKFALKCFGVGDGWPSADRNHASFLYRFGEVSILVDCGEGISRSFKASGLDYDTIDRLFISHLHADHIGGFFMLMQGFWLEKRKKYLPVSMPVNGIRPFQQLMQAGFIFDELLKFKLKFEPLEAGKAVMTGNVRITPYPTTHLERLRLAFQEKYPQEFIAYSFLIEHADLRIGHSADIGRPEDLEPLLKKPLDLLVCELSHFRPEDLFVYLQGRAIKRIVFMHLARAFWADLEAMKKLAAKMLPGIECSFAKDSEEIVL